MKRWRDSAIYVQPHKCWYQQGKICYDKRGAVSAKNIRYKQSGIVLREYWCDKCNFWHLTKNINFNHVDDQEEELEPIIVDDNESE